MKKKEDVYAPEVPLWKNFFVVILLPILCFFSFEIILPEIKAVFSDVPLVSYSFRKMYVLLSPVIFVPLEVMLVSKLFFKVDTNCFFYRFLEKFILYMAIFILLSAPLSSFFIEWYIKEKGYTYCEERSDIIWRQVYVLKDELCVPSD